MYKEIGLQKLPTDSFTAGEVVDDTQQARFLIRHITLIQLVKFFLGTVY
ncbi:hypothetical protein JQ760_028225 (plasmid) [Klebsiella pneumoniae]|nr:hypothetical protein [Klebsiella pneumoniae]MCI8108450.1 hypothetical protein [Klebsiella pneumoniae]